MPNNNNSKCLGYILPRGGSSLLHFATQVIKFVTKYESTQFLRLANIMDKVPSLRPYFFRFFTIVQHNSRPPPLTIVCLNLCNLDSEGFLPQQFTSNDQGLPLPHAQHGRRRLPDHDISHNSLLLMKNQEPIPVAFRPKACVCGQSLAGTAGSNLAGSMDVCIIR
jgi:hypothetical protein